MFDFRYHALSLVAVFMALVIGLLLGVAIGDEGLVSSAERDIRDSLRKDVRDARAESARLRAQVNEEKELERQFYPLMVGGRLPAQRVGIVALGGIPDGVVDNVRDALAPTGGRLANVSVVKLPPDTTELAADERGTRFATLAQDPEVMRRFGRRIGVDFVRDGRDLRTVRSTLLSSSSGTLDGLRAVVLYRQGGEVSGPAGAATAALEDGLVAGFRRGRVPLVGVEESSRNPSGIPWLADRGISSVDNVDQVTGRTSMVFVLAGASGAFGTKDTATRLLPEAPGG
ncbi:MAG: copper transporter [Solirubrobacteraceae bacterium]